MKKKGIVIALLIVLFIVGLCLLILPPYLKDVSLNRQAENDEAIYQKFKIKEIPTVTYQREADTTVKPTITSENKKISEITETITPEVTLAPSTATPTSIPENTQWNPFEVRETQKTGLFSATQPPKEGTGTYKTEEEKIISPVENPEEYNNIIKENEETSYNDTEKIIEPEITPEVGRTGVDLVACQQANSDFVAWIKIDNTNIDYPIVHTNNIDYYLDHNFDGNKSELGTLFSLTKCSWSKPSKNIAIYGHDVEGSGKKMFKQLLDYKSYEFYANHSYVYIDSIYRTGTYKIFAAFDITQGEFDPAVSSFASEDDYMSFVETAKNLSIYNTNVDVSPESFIVTLITCDRFFKSKVGRFIVMAVKVS